MLDNQRVIGTVCVPWPEVQNSSKFLYNFLMTKNNIFVQD